MKHAFRLALKFFAAIFLLQFSPLHAQDTLGAINELQQLLKERKERFNQYSVAAEQHSGIFKTTTKKDLMQSREILLQIMKTDDNILNKVGEVIAQRGMAKADYSVDEMQFEQTIATLTQATDTLNKQLAAERQLNKTLISKTQTQQGLIYIIGAIAAVLLIALIVKLIF